MSRGGSFDSSHLPSICPPEFSKPPHKRPPRRRKAPKKSPVKKYEPVNVHHGVAEAGPSNSDTYGPVSPRNEPSLPSSVESPAEENLLEPDNRVCESKNEVGDGSGCGVVIDVMTVLEELQLGAEEPELSSDQFRINDQLQEDELLAMESIYGENVIILDRQRGLRSFEIRIEPKIPDELTITTKLPSSNSKMQTTSTTSTADEFSYSFRVQFVPPIVLTCSFPKSYPSHKPPHFTISVQWLDSLRISSLCSVLDSIWMEQQGQEVMYQWIDWLQSFSLPHLGIHQEILLGPYGVKHTGDRRAVSESVSPDVDIPSLRRYNDEQTLENFLNNLHECCICFSEYPGSDFFRLPCQHFFCRNCIKTYSDLHVSEGTVNKLLCPQSKCGGMVPPGLLKQLLGDEKYERYESLLLQKTLECMSDAVYCPRCEFVCIEDDDNFAQCPKCFFNFCSLCKNARHVGEPCLTPELKLQLLEMRLKSSQISSTQRLAEQNKINELLSEKEIARDAKLCPHCKMAISKTEGCNKMVCGSCGNYFCYLCNKAITGYEHFRDGACELFSQEAIQQWEAQMNMRQTVGRVRAELNLGEAHSCPNCGQRNAKTDNNNHIFCWACQKHYCYLCRKVVKRSSEHYGPKKCKQHTAG
ncbi:unnamed protein product [Linum tenue]|uniref:E3 ubiquitin-protein ligase RNF14 n=1 Tax=Linum tenue TaxID=586396 RepID=A0AAV0PKG1_9ROSI|nr:unnamed protein product [Linum tenue]